MAQPKGQLVTKDVGGRTFIFGHIPAMKAVKVECILVKTLGEPLFRAAAGAGGEEAQGADGSESVEKAAVSMAIAVLVANLKEEEILRLQLLVFCSVGLGDLTIDSAEKIDTVFTGTPRDLWLVFWEALKVNFADFLPEDPSALIERLKRMVKSSQSKAPTSTGGSGDR